MTGSRWVDIAIVLVALIAATSGWRQGAVASALAFVGVILGAVAGILLAPHLLVHVTEGKLRILAGISLIVVLVIIGEVSRHGARTRGAQRNAQSDGAIRRQRHRCGSTGGGRRGRGVVARDSAHFFVAAEYCRRCSWFGCSRQRGRTGAAVAAPHPDGVFGVARHLRPAGRHRPVRAYAHHRGRSTRRERSGQSVGGAVASECSTHQRRRTELPARARGSDSSSPPNAS